MKPNSFLTLILAVVGSSLFAISTASAQLYWDTDGSTAGFGTASGTWGVDAFWNTSNTGGAGTFSAATTTSSLTNFGNGATGLAAGTINVDGTVDSGNMTFSSGTTGVILSGGKINFASGATLTFANRDNAINSEISGSGALTFSTTHTSDGQVSNTTLGKISNSGNVTFVGTYGTTSTFSTFTLNQASTYIGTTTLDVTANTANILLVLGATDALSKTTVVQFSSDAASGSGRRNNIDLNGYNQEIAGLQSTAGANRILRVNNTSSTAATLTINDNGNRTFQGMLGSDSVGTAFNLSSGNNFNVVKNGTGIWTLNAQATGTSTNSLAAPNSYTGGTILNQGGITLGTSATLGSGSLQVNNTNSTAAGTGVVLTATASNLTVGSLSGTIATPTSGINTATINTAGRTFTVNQTANGTYAGTISGASGNFTLGASSTHTLTLTGTNTYTGTTNVNGGTLIINGSTSTSSLVTVATIGTLGGSGTVGGATTVNGTLRPGNSPGELTFSNILTLTSTATTVMEIDGTAGAGVTNGYDFVNLTGSGAQGVLTYSGTLTLDIGTIFGVGSYSWNLFDFASESGTFTSIALTDQYSGTLLDGNTDGIWDLTSGNDTWSFTESTGVLGLTVIPEPKAVLLGSLGVLLLLRRRRH